MFNFYSNIVFKLCEWDLQHEDKWMLIPMDTQSEASMILRNSGITGLSPAWDMGIYNCMYLLLH
jgi:hypothetical protein